MKKCYEDVNLHVSKGAFEKPADLSIKVDCYTPRAYVRDTSATDSTAVKPEEQNTDEFQF